MQLQPVKYKELDSEEVPRETCHHKSHTCPTDPTKMQNPEVYGHNSNGYSINSISTLVKPPDGFRWKRKAIRARIITGVLTVAFTVLVILLVLTYELELHCPVLTNNNPTTDDQVVKFLHVSDFHLDLYFDPNVRTKTYFCRRGDIANATFSAPYGRVGCDSPQLLVENSLEALKNESKKQAAEFMLFTGDMSCHKLDQAWFSGGSASQRVFDSISQGSQLLSESFPDIPVFPIVGNNDLPGHYVLPNATSNWYERLLKLWSTMITCSNCPSSVPRPTTMAVLEKSFLEGGYYNASIAGGRMTLLVLNTLYFNVYGSINTTFIQNKAKTHMQWIEDQLKIARQAGRKVILSSHIPPGIDPYNSNPFWLKKYTEAYVKLVRDTYRDVVAGQLYAHIHKDDFHLQTSSKDKANTTFILLAPSISPVYKNNPAFRVVSLDPERQVLVDYEQYYMDLVLATEFGNPAWILDYKFNRKYPSSNPIIDGKRIDELNQKLIKQTTDTSWKEYVFSRTVLYQPSPYDRFELYCAMRYVFQDDFQKCLAKYKVTGG